MLGFFWGGCGVDRGTDDRGQMSYIWCRLMDSTTWRTGGYKVVVCDALQWVGFGSDNRSVTTRRMVQAELDVGHLRVKGHRVNSFSPVGSYHGSVYLIRNLTQFLVSNFQ